MMAGHFLLLGFRRCVPRRRMMMPAMRQAAHPVAICHSGIIRARQQSQWRSQQRDNHENSLHTAHRQKFYHSLSRLGSNTEPRSTNFAGPGYLDCGGLPPPSYAEACFGARTAAPAAFAADFLRAVDFPDCKLRNYARSRGKKSPGVICARKSVAVRWLHRAALQIDLRPPLRPEPG